MRKQYNENGYNTTKDFQCDEGCSKPFSGVFCLHDDFGESEYYIDNYMDPTCVVDYADLVRHRVENMFPVKLLNSLCVGEKSKIPTGRFFFKPNRKMELIFSICFPFDFEMQVTVG